MQNVTIVAQLLGIAYLQFLAIIAKDHRIPINFISL